jgi:hypothetical protein
LSDFESKCDSPEDNGDDVDDGKEVLLGRLSEGKIRSSGEVSR